MLPTQYVAHAVCPTPPPPPKAICGILGPHATSFRVGRTNVGVAQPSLVRLHDAIALGVMTNVKGWAELRRDVHQRTK